MADSLGWRRVEDELPQPYNTVLVYGPQAPVVFAYYVDGAQYYRGGQWYRVGTCRADDTRITVTHWMPLPEPPEGGE